MLPFLSAVGAGLPQTEAAAAGIGGKVGFRTHVCQLGREAAPTRRTVGVRTQASVRERDGAWLRRC